MKQLFYFAVVALFFLFTCNSSQKMVIPSSRDLPSVDDNYSIVWVGKGESFIYQNGEYQRDKTNDYSFEVVQRRYGNSWKSVKNMHRIHPDYNGKAGPREQTMFFAIDFAKEQSQIISKINSSLGNGNGASDSEFREQQMQIAVEGISSMAPYNTIRISQHYQYEKGILLETVELFKLKGEEEIPFVRIEEKAIIFRPTTLEKAPTEFDFNQP